MMRLIVIVAAILLLIVVYGAYAVFVANPRVVEELRSDPHGERAAKAMLLTFADGRTIPVNYLRENDTVFIGADGPWWRSLRDEGEVTVEIRGEKFAGHAVVVLDDPEYTQAVFNRLRPSVPGWLPDWLNGKLIVISLQQTSGVSVE
jgi:hypothetical protein